MKSTTVRNSTFLLTTLPSLERSVFGWTMTVLTASTVVLGLLGWGLSLQAHAAEPVIASNEQETPVQTEPSRSAADLGGVVVPDCNPPNPVICFTNMGSDYGADELEGTGEAGIQRPTSTTNTPPPLTPYNPDRANILEIFRTYF